MAGVKIASLELENVKRVRAVALRPAEDGLTVIGGRNGQGKTSVLDGIAYALGGERMRPDRTKREGSATDAMMRVELSNGIVVERRGKNSALKVTDPAGRKAGQSLLNSFIEELALNLPKFLAKSDREKADELLRIIGVGEELERMDREIESLGEERLGVGQSKRAKRKVAEEAPWYPDAPTETVSAADLLDEQRRMLERNAENARVRRELAMAVDALGRAGEEADGIASRIEGLKAQLADKRRDVSARAEAVKELESRAESAVDADLSDIERRIAEVDTVNEQVRANGRRAEMLAEADALDEEWSRLTEDIDAAKEERMKLLEGADMPLEGIGVEDGKLTYMGQTWGDMSGSEQLRVATAIVRRLKPECGFVLVDKLEQMDARTLAEFADWAESEGLQVIGTRVAADESCTVIIEDGRVASPEADADADGADGAAQDAAAETLRKPEPAAPVLQMGVF